MNRTLDKYTAEELLTEAECIEAVGEYIHLDLLGYTPEELRTAAEEKENGIER